MKDIQGELRNMPRLSFVLLSRDSLLCLGEDLAEHLSRCDEHLVPAILRQEIESGYLGLLPLEVGTDGIELSIRLRRERKPFQSGTSFDMVVNKGELIVCIHPNSGQYWDIHRPPRYVSGEDANQRYLLFQLEPLHIQLSPGRYTATLACVDETFLTIKSPEDTLKFGQFVLELSPTQ